jgi:phenylalanyl-tRNA synthetase alpha chain
VTAQLHLQPDHPLGITRNLIESRFPGYSCYNDLFPIVTVGQNFDSLEFPPDHPGRSRTDTYYINKDTVLRTHTSAHQLDIFRANQSAGFLISADVYRRDEIDRSHYPIFHQMEGAMTWDRNETRALAADVWHQVAQVPRHDINVEDPNPTIHPERNPLQAGCHSVEEVEAMAAHLKRSLEDVVVAIFTAAKGATALADGSESEPLRVRWVEAYFPFTSPSWELEVFWNGDWLEVLGCGIIKQSILANAGVPSRQGWAFGLGLERIAMLLFGISLPRNRYLGSRHFQSTLPAPRTLPFGFVVRQVRPVAS